MSKVIRNIALFWIATLFISALCIHLFSCSKEKISDSQADFFTKFYGSSGKNFGNDVISLSDGGFLIAGTSEIIKRSYDAVLIRTDRFGNEIWKKNFGDTLDNFGNSVKQTPDGGFILLGTTMVKSGETEHSDLFLIKADAYGNKQWEKKIGTSLDQEGKCVALTIDGGFILLGSTTDKDLTNSNPQGMKDIYLVKVTSIGEIEWTRSRGGPDNDFGSDIKIKNGGGYVILGTTQSFKQGNQGGSNIILIETNDLGYQTDMITYGGEFDDFGDCLKVLSDNSYLIASTITLPDLTNGMNVIKLMPGDIRTVQWEKSVEHAKGTYAKSVISADLNSVVIAGTSLAGGSRDICISKFTQTGDNLYTKRFGYELADEAASSIISSSDGSYIVVGTNYYEGPSMITLLKVKPSGDQH